MGWDGMGWDAIVYGTDKDGIAHYYIRDGT